MRSCRPSQIKSAHIHKATPQDKILYDNEWLQLRDRDGYIFSHEIRCNGRIVVVLPYKRTGKDSWTFLVRNETTPCWGGPTLSCITGGVEGEDPLDDAVRELKEEAGYEVPREDFIALGKCRGSKSSDTWYYLYAVDVANYIPGKALGDGTPGDLAHIVWISDMSELVDAQGLAAYVKACKKLRLY